MANLHADHVGSLLRPPELLEARAGFRAGRVSADQLHAVEDAAILNALDLQKQAGVEIFTDGEYRRATFLDPLSTGIEGFIDVPDVSGGVAWRGPNASIATETMDVTGLNRVVGAKLRRVGRQTDTAFLKQHSPGPWKMTVPGPTMRLNYMYRPGISDKAYATEAELRSEMVGFIQAEVKDLVADGVSYFQLDSLSYVGLANAPHDALDAIIAADNAIIDVAKAGGVTVGLHMCRGNNRSAWISEGNYEHLEHAFNALHADRFLLEYDSERAGGFEPLRFMPRDKTVVLGIISSKLPALEPVDTLRRRIDEAAKYVPLENLAISPQCGFASSAPGNLLTWDDMRRKLELVTETARLVWG
ncbi:MAG TPA: cobalamin-independent methionine synthase II family protein [Dehalococcoidia bacterium]|nr:cobalamin-independent methionine synthase II family protein [Dehalococcoidia bacterium]